MARVLKILTAPNLILRKKSDMIDFKRIKKNELEKLLKDMEMTMKKNDGVGLAAPQIGKNIRIVVINVKSGTIFMINPKITRKSILKEIGEEGCLSVPDVFGKVKRHKNINCKYFDLSGKEIRLKSEGLLARVIQHELDHLDGILFIDKATDIVTEKKNG